VSVRLGLLALLDQGACYGYQLRTELDWRTGASGPINVGQIYNTLDRLERDKLVRKTGHNNYYEITAAGRDAVSSWFASASPTSDLPAKLALATTLPGVDVGDIIRIQRASRVGDLRTGASAGTPTPTTGQEVARAIMTAATVAAADSERLLLDATERLFKLGIKPTPLNIDIPKRGRPAKISAESS
jgi:DNA-binding PadR family transcriptional regulator